MDGVGTGGYLLTPLRLLTSPLPPHGVKIPVTLDPSSQETSKGGTPRQTGVPDRLDPSPPVLVPLRLPHPVLLEPLRPTLPVPYTPTGTPS